MRQVVASVISSMKVVPGIYLVWLDSPEIATEAKPGQFVMVRCGEDTMLYRPLSIHQLPDEISPTKFAFLFTVVGKGTTWLSQREAGNSIELLGPLGNGYIIHPTSRNLLLLAGGIGIAPLHYLTQHALNQGCSVTLLLGASTATQLYPRHLLPEETQVIVTTEDGTEGQKGMITDLLLDFTGWADQIFACGPISMYQAMAARKQKFLKTKSVQVSLEVKMGCGRGLCYGCTVKTKRGLKQVCQDGPVFDLDNVLWGELGY
ncbi:dihydroorotate dehydrogenase electron transfer subunit [Chloroflexota bacterium]